MKQRYKAETKTRTRYRCHPSMIHFNCPIAARMKRSLFSLVSRVGPHARKPDLGIGVEKKGLESQRQRKAKRNKDKNRMGKGENKELPSVPFCPSQAP
jgi:hypothetical protein